MTSHDAKTDAELVEAAAAGDGDAFEVIYRRYRDWVVRLAWRFTRNQDDALDVLQQTFAWLLTRLPGLQLSARLTTFLYPVVRSISVTMLRKRRRSGDDAALAVIPAPDPAGAPAGREELADVLGMLPDGQREVLLMRFVDDMTLEEIATALNIPLGTVKSRIHNALATLRADPRARAYFTE